MKGRPRIFNEYITDGEITQMKLTNGNFALIDTNDIPLVKSYSWYQNKQGYVYTRLNVNGKSKRLFLHRLICGIDDADWRIVQTDHKYGNTLDNRKSMLRVCTNAENQINKQRPRKDNSSGCTGVYYEKRWRGRWIATIGFNKDLVTLGYFNNKEDAIKARKQAEKQYYSEFAV
jgi:hypothetical protein